MDSQSRQRSRLSVHAPFAVVLGLVVIGVMWIAFRHWREGPMLIGGALLLAALLRLLITHEQVGLLAIRSRTVDIVLYVVLAALLIFTAATITGRPFGT